MDCMWQRLTPLCDQIAWPCLDILAVYMECNLTLMSFGVLNMTRQRL